MVTTTITRQLQSMQTLLGQQHIFASGKNLERESEVEDDERGGVGEVEQTVLKLESLYVGRNKVRSILFNLYRNRAVGLILIVCLLLPSRSYLIMVNW